MTRSTLFFLLFTFVGGLLLPSACTAPPHELRAQRKMHRIADKATWSDAKTRRQMRRLRRMGVGGCCFMQGTCIQLANGGQAMIQDLRAGQAVLGFDPATGTTRPARIAELTGLPHDNLYRLTFAHTVIEVTEDHPFWIAGKGWASLNPEMTRQFQDLRKVSEVQVCDAFFLRDPFGQVLEAPLLSVEQLPGSYMTYTITRLENADQFFANGVAAGVEHIRGGFRQFDLDMAWACID